MGAQLEFIMAREHQSKLSHVEDIHDERRKKQLRLEDDIEDFLDESKYKIQEHGVLILQLYLLGYHGIWYFLFLDCFKVMTVLANWF